VRRLISKRDRLALSSYCSRIFCDRAVAWSRDLRAFAKRASFSFSRDNSSALALRLHQRVRKQAKKAAVRRQEGWDAEQRTGRRWGRELETESRRPTLFPPDGNGELERTSPPQPLLARR